MLVSTMLAALFLVGTGCQPTTGNGDNGGAFEVDADSTLIGTWLFSNGTTGGAPQPVNGTVVQVLDTGSYVVLDNRETPIQRGDWGVRDDEVRFTPTQDSLDGLWIGTFTASWEIQNNTILRLTGQDGSLSALIHFYERQP